MSVANSRMTVGSILAAVQTTANTATGALTAINSAVGMANKFVTDAALRQDVRSKLDNAIFEKTLHQEKSQELAESRIQMEAFAKQSEAHAKHYQLAYDELASLLKAD